MTPDMQIQLESSTRDDVMCGPQDGEDPKKRVDRELRELLEEIRVALPGVELLFGFLLILPFSDKFGDLGEVQRAVYLAGLVATAAASALFIAPTAQHRLGFRVVNKERLLIRTNRLVIAGLVLVSFAISLAVYLVVWVVLNPTWAWLIAAPITAWFIGWWFLMPHALLRRRSSGVTFESRA
ncbi:MAG: DUF6328 family protein [Kofleriaceae bacterium]